MRYKTIVDYYMSRLKFLLFGASILLCPLFFLQKAYANVNAIDFSQIKYPTQLQGDIDFLKGHDYIYNHWVHDWNADVPKAKVTGTLTSLFAELSKLTNKNTETYLALGDIAHYLYNMEVDEYYQKALDNYEQAKALSPRDYRVYWFLGNHYALSDKAVLAIQTYQVALQYKPAAVHQYFWADYAVACGNASMLGTARYAARQESKVEGQESYVEKELLPVFGTRLKTAPVDSAIKSDEIWDLYGAGGSNVIINNYLLGLGLKIDSNWNYEVSDYRNRKSHITLVPFKATSKKGRKISYSIMVLAGAAKSGETLQQFLDLFTGTYTDRKLVSFKVGNVNSGLAYEIKDPSVYKDIGGGHFYAMAIERNAPEFPGMALETPVEMPKPQGGTGEMKFYRAPQIFGRLSSKIYYLILLDSCEDIHEESTAVFDDFLRNVTIE